MISYLRRLRIDLRIRKLNSRARPSPTRPLILLAEAVEDTKVVEAEADTRDHIV